MVYYPARRVLAGTNPYDARPPELPGSYLSRFPAGNAFPLYAPLLLVLSAPLANLPLESAELLYCAFNIAMLAFYAYMLVRMGSFPTDVFAVASLAGLLLISRPGHANYYYGAITLVIVVASPVRLVAGGSPTVARGALSRDRGDQAHVQRTAARSVVHSRQLSRGAARD